MNSALNAYWKGGLVVATLIAAMVAVYLHFVPQLAVNKNPEHFAQISKMENEGIPRFQLPGLDGSIFDSKELKNKVAIVNFWASWCNPCVQEFPSLLQLVEKFNGEVVLVAISADENRADVENFLKLFKGLKPHVHILLDPERKVGQLFGVEKLPESFLVGKDSHLIRKIIGIDNWFTPGAVAYFTNLTGFKPEP